MITQLTGRTRNAYTQLVNKELTLSVMGTRELSIKIIDGLGPVDAELTGISLPLEAGGQTLSAKPGERDIVVTVEFRPDYGSGSTVTSLRKSLMSVFAPANIVELEFLDDEGDAFKISGTVQTHVPNNWVKDPTVQISIHCADPYFKKINEGVVTQIIPINSAPLIKVPFEGDVSWGFDFEFEILEPPINGVITLQKLPQMETNYLSIKDTFLTGDIIKLSTVKGRRLATRTRDGVTTDILGKFTGSLVATRLTPGDNYFSLANIDYTKNVKFRYERVYGEL